jgi:hypothetical protein
MSLQSYAINTGGNAQIWMVDLETGAKSLMDYSTGAQAFENEPRRWKPAAMSDADYAATLEARKS